jgi:hypothetical protein
MRKLLFTVSVMFFLGAPLLAQSVRLWVLRTPGEMVEYDPATFAQRQRVSVPAQALEAPQDVSVNSAGQILFVPAVSLPLAASDLESPPKVWLWNGKAASAMDQGVSRKTAAEGSNVAIQESAPVPYLSADGSHLFWIANQAHRLQRDEVDLSTANTWQAWLTDLNGAGRQELTSSQLPECRCTTGACEEKCPYMQVWAPPEGIEKFFLLTQVVPAATPPAYKETTGYREEGGKWSATPLAIPLHRILDASTDGRTILEAVPDTGCCGWSNESDDQTLLWTEGKQNTVFDERATFNNPDYDVSFYTADAKLSHDGSHVAFTIAATAQANQTIQLAEQGQANPEESARIRKALAELPAAEVKSIADPSRRVAYLPHAALVGWISEKEILLVESHLLVACNVATGARRKSTIRVDDAAHVFVRWGR